MVRAKFYVSSIKRYSGWQGATVELTPVMSQDPNHENKKFWDATPSGKIEMSIKTDAIEQFELGKEYYVDFTLAPVPVPA